MTIRVGRKVYILVHENKILGAWTNLQSLCLHMKEETVFPSYSKLTKEVNEIRKNMKQDSLDNGTIEFKAKDGKDYTIQIENLK
jgi:hypothetical protein